MAYNVRYVKGIHLNQIQDEWKALETGEEMTLFQSYQWYQVLLEQYVPVDTRKYESLYAVVESDGQPCMIAPLWVVKKTFRLLNHKGAYMLGRGSFSDYLNLVYQHFDGDAFDYLSSDLARRYGITCFTIEQLRETTSVYRHILDKYVICRNSEYPCVGLNLPSSVEEYNRLLSKNSRQNIRTANNRLKKDGKTLVYNFDDRVIDKKRCLEIREAKQLVNYSKLPLLYRYKYKILNFFRFHFNSFVPFISFSESKVMTAYDEGGCLRAFFNYGYDTDGRCIRVMTAGTDLDYARYSPGLLLMYNFILNSIQEGNIKEIDFTRGDEKYKFSLGGQQRTIHTVKFKIKRC
jgi:CelD/BcsL family acetyltransferase involved in cellulose biosynthesis